ncbi:MAG: hypothetical protein ABIZ81_05155, partial [Opitutaceae bacterium]
MKLCPGLVPSRFRHVLLLATVSASAALVLAAADKKTPRGLQVLVSADAAPSQEGFRPKPGKPVHYLFSQTRQTLGDAVAGVKLPAPEVIEKAIVAELAKQGFVRGEIGGPIPSIYIVAIVGDSNFEEPRIDLDNPLQDGEISNFMYQVNVRALLDRNLLSGKVSSNLETLFDPDRRASPDEQEAKELILNEAMRLRFRASPRFQDKNKIMALVGADKIDKAVSDKTVSSSDAEAMAWSVYENRYFVTLNAFDAMRWKNKEKVLLWRTTMIIDWRKDLASELPSMLAQAGPMFGTDVAVPTLLDNRDKRKGEVEVGPLKVVPPEDASA